MYTAASNEREAIGLKKGKEKYMDGLAGRRGKKKTT